MKHVITLAALLLTLCCVAQDKQYTIVFLNKKPDAENISPEETKAIMDGHMANMQRLASENKLLAAGPFHGGGGIFIMNSGSREEVESWISTDPGVKAKRWRIEILPFHPRYGGVCPVGEKYEMITYTFFRFDAVVSKFNSPNFPELIAEHDKFLATIRPTGNVVSDAIFSDRDGGILILKGEADPEMFNGDPAVSSGLIDVQHKKLYIARGSFCEQ